MNNNFVSVPSSTRVFWRIGCKFSGYTFCIGTEAEAEFYRIRRGILSRGGETKVRVTFEEIPGETEILELRDLI